MADPIIEVETHGPITRVWVDGATVTEDDVTDVARDRLGTDALPTVTHHPEDNTYEVAFETADLT